MIAFAHDALRGACLERVVAVPGGGVAVVVESIDEASKDGVSVVVVDW